MKYRGYEFNINVKLDQSAVKTIGGTVTHLITVNDMGVAQYYRQYTCMSEDLEKTIELAWSAACEWAEERENDGKSIEEILLKKMGFE